MQNPYSKYTQISAHTAPKEELTLMLYEGALKFCNQAIASVEKHDAEAANNYIIRVEKIIREFQLTLNRSYEVAEYFDKMYEYMHRRLIEANVGKDAEILIEVRDFLREFRDMWKETMQAAKSKK